MKRDTVREESQEIWAAYGQDPQSPNVRSTWWALFHRASDGDNLFRLPLGDAALLLACGAFIEIAAGHYDQAVDLLRLYFRHPNVGEAALPDRVGMPSYLAYGLLWAGEEAEAVAIYRSLLDSPDRQIARHAPLQVAALLRDYLRSRPENQRASEALCELVYEAVRRLRRRALPRFQTGERATCADLRAILDTATRTESSS